MTLKYALFFYTAAGLSFPAAGLADGALIAAPIASTRAASGLLTMPPVASDPVEVVPAPDPVAQPDGASVEQANGLPVTPAAGEDLWERIRDGFALEEFESPLVLRHEAWYLNRPEYVARMIDRSRRYLYHIVAEVEKRDMPMEIALLPMIESAYNPTAYSRARAAGMW